MAEEEKIREHAKHALQDLTNKNKKWKDRIKDFAWEVFIIIVAVNITLLFHSWSEKRQERELEKKFFIGIRSDLAIVNRYLFNDSISYQPQLRYYDSICTQIDEHRIDKVYVDNANTGLLLNNQDFYYDNSRFENFKSSGYLRLIENDSLLMKIVSLYTIDLPWVKSMDEFAHANRQDFVDYIGAKAVDSSGKIIISDLLNAPEAKFKIRNRQGMLSERQRLKWYIMQDIEQVITQIDRELKTRFNYQEK